MYHLSPYTYLIGGLVGQGLFVSASPLPWLILPSSCWSRTNRMRTERASDARTTRRCDLRGLFGTVHREQGRIREQPQRDERLSFLFERDDGPVSRTTV